MWGRYWVDSNTAPCGTSAGLFDVYKSSCIEWSFHEPQNTPMAQEMFHFIVYVNGCIIQGENGAYFHSDAPLMFRNTRVSTLHELKRVILSHLGANGPRDIRRLAYRFQAVTPDDRLEYRPSWLSEDRHVWITFEVYRRIMQDRFMEFLCRV
ncbi:hypothetical protein PIB30_054192 [Stylosanthes scabra]|uniref:Uncharacterized protein n=1 Tax=Stylosanthes scabra TaxID=79078 RepID=A0ABU6ZHI0_9FABA|nr:hypothetical protein [Stylosanthes scabra]